MAIAEELASRHPDIAFWPTDPLASGTSRARANEMHANFSGLRGDWSVNLRTAKAVSYRLALSKDDYRRASITSQIFAVTFVPSNRSSS